MGILSKMHCMGVITDSDVELVDFTIRNEAFLKGESEHTGK